MTDPSGPPVKLVWPTMRRPTPPFQIVYPDLNHWIALAKAATRHPEGLPFAAVLDACRQARVIGRAVFPLAGPLYVEVSKIKDPR